MFCMLINIKVFYRLILIFFMGVVQPYPKYPGKFAMSL